MSYYRKSIRKIINLSFYVLIFLVVLELCARLDDKIKYNAPLLPTYSNKLLRSSDSEGLRYNIPKARFEKWQNNNFGFRGPDIKLEKEEGISRIVCMGTSETYGLFESPGKEWPAQLSHILDSLNSYEVINAATVGLRRELYLKYMDKYVYKLDPDIIIFMISPTFIDRQDNSNPVKKNKNSLKVKETKERQLSISDFISNIRIIPKTWQIIKKFVAKTLLEKYQYYDRSKKIREMERRFLKGKKPFDNIPIENQQKYTEDIKSIVTNVQSKGIKVILCTYPYLMSYDNLDKYPLIFMEGRRFIVELSYDGMIQSSKLGDSIIQLVANTYSTGYVDCNKLLPKNTDYFGDNIHLTNLGAEIVAKSIAEYITSQGSSKH